MNTPSRFLAEPPFSCDDDPLKDPFLQTSHTATSKSPSLSSQPSHARSKGSLVILPAAYHDRSNNLRAIDEHDQGSVQRYVEWELFVSRLNEIHKHLWLAGRPTSARPLHRQLMIGREILVTEQIDLHLLWQESRLYLKPLPEYLMNFDFWKDYICKDKELYESACGFVLSYIWLVCHRSDLRMAQSHGLLPQEISWQGWTAFTRSLLRSIDVDSLEGIGRRYHYGELRLSRLNWIYRIFSKSRTPTTLIRGYMYGHNRYSVFMQRKFAWVFAVFVSFTVVLTAMQVGLATDQLGKDGRFQHASYGFAIFSILASLIAVIVFAWILFGLFMFNLLATLSFKRRTEQYRQAMVKSKIAGIP